MPAARQVAWLAGLTPIARIDLHGIEYAQIYDLRHVPQPAFVTTWAQQGNAQIRLNAYELTAGMVQPGATVHTIINLENLAPIAENLNVLVRLVGMDGTELARDEGWPWERLRRNGKPARSGRMAMRWQFRRRLPPATTGWRLVFTTRPVKHSSMPPKQTVAKLCPIWCRSTISKWVTCRRRRQSAGRALSTG
ncbi:MAG: hypothetical protein R2867_02170 [Caldilineaceae bacterium]